MIIGGYSYPFNDSTVELYNWLTGFKKFKFHFMIIIIFYDNI